MLISFRSKNEVITRSYDVAGVGFSPLPSNEKNPQADEEKFQWSLVLIKDLLAIFSSITLSALGYGILMVMIALRLEANVKNEILMSISAATQLGAGIIFARFLPSVGKKFGMINSIRTGSIVSAICALLLYKYFGYLPLLLIILALGISLFTCGVTRNTIMIDLAPTHVRAIVISFGTMLVAIGNSFGPIIVNTLKSGDGFTSFAVASGFYILSILPLSRLKKIDSILREEKKISIWRYMKNSPKIMFAGFTVNYAMASASAFSIIYGIKIGMSQSDASLLLSVLLFGTIFYIPLGYLSDIINRRMLMIFFATLSLLCAYALYINHDVTKIYSLLFLMFGCLAGVKLPAVVLINEKYKPSQRLAVNSAFARMCLCGNIFGLFATGFIMKEVGPQGLWLSLIVILLLFLLFCCLNYSKKIVKKEFKLSDFSIFNKHKNEQMSDV